MPMTGAERAAKYRLEHGKRKAAVCLSRPELFTTCIPRGNLDLDEMEVSARKTMALFDRLVAVVEIWIDRVNLDPEKCLANSLPF
jgi:hypothetical protein